MCSWCYGLNKNIPMHILETIKPMKNIKKQVILALATMSSSMAFAAPLSQIDADSNVYIFANNDNDFEKQSEGIFISSNGGSSPYYSLSGEFDGQFQNLPNTPKPFAGGYYVGNVDASGNLTSTKALSGNFANSRDASGNLAGAADASGNYLYTPVSGHASTAAYDASGNLTFTTARSGNLTPQGDIASGSFSTASYSDGELGLTSSTSFATNTNNTAYSLSSQIVGPNGFAANVSGVVNTEAGAASLSTQIVGPNGFAANVSGVVNVDGGSAATTIALTGPGGNALLGNLTGSLATNTISGTISGAGGGPVNGSGESGLFGSEVAGGVITGSVTIGKNDSSGNVVAPSASASAYITNLDGSASHITFVGNTASAASIQYMNVDASGNSFNQTGVITTDGEFHGLSVSNSATSVSAGYNNGGMYFDSNGVTVGRVDESGNIVNTSQIHGVAAGTAATDAVNVSQLNQQVNGLKGGIASTVAMANIPQVDQGKKFAIGMGLGHYAGASAVSVGGSIRVNESAIIKGSIGRSFSSSGSADTSTTAGVGAAFSW